MITLICDYCKNPFEHYRWNVKYCNNCGDIRFFDLAFRSQRARAIKLGLTEHASAPELRNLYNEQKGVCRCCGSNRKIAFDHIVALHNGGKNTIDNLQLLCGICNSTKGKRKVNLEQLKSIVSNKPVKTEYSFNLTDEADKLLGKMADKNGISKSAVLEIIIREAAKNQGIENSPSE